jgi:MFS family permease
MKQTGNKSFGKFLTVWSGQLISSIGSGLTAFSLGVHAFEKTGLATSVALITLFSFLPSILLRPIGGWLADRYDRRLMMMVGDAGSAAGLVFILLMMAAGYDAMWPIYIGVTFSSVFMAVLAPAYKASATDLLTEEQFSKGSGLMQLAESSRFLFSPIIAGLLLSIASIETVLVINIGTYAAAVLAVLVVRQRMTRMAVPERASEGLLDGMADGWRAITENRGVLLLILIISLVAFYIGFLQTLIGPMILTFSDAKMLGTIQSASAVGMLASSLAVGMISLRGRYVEALVFGLMAAGLSMSLMGVTTSTAFIMLAGFLFLASLPFVNAAADVLVRINIPNEKQGRAWGLIGVLSQFGFVVAYGISGPLADHVFNPMLADGGLLASSVGSWIGTGEGRGIGFMFILAGLLVVVLALVTSGIRSIRELARKAAEESKETAVAKQA